MGNSETTGNENILVKVDQNNLMYIDPNSVIDANGEIQPRGLKQENLVMYANLEADIIPRSSVVAADQGSTLVSIAKGNLNFLRNQSGDGNFDTSWTDAFVPKPIEGQESNYRNGNDLTFSSDSFRDPSGQSFGIDSINVIVKGANFTPRVTINFVDVRGKTLFEATENSPYRAFFHLPWPIFYLTLKGYYGKAIRYRLHLTKFTSRFNESNGNFEITTEFVGSTYAFMNDITLSSIINAPYMFLTENSEDRKFNENTGKYEKKITKGSRGYSILKSIYSQYKQKGLVPQDFPVKTLKELGYIAESLDKILEKQIFNNVVDMSIFQGIKELDKTLNDFENAIKSWSKQNLSNTEYEVVNEQNWYYLSQKDKDKLDKVTGKDTNGTLEKLITVYTESLKKSTLFSNNQLNKTGADFKKINIGQVKNIGSYYNINTSTKKVMVGIDLLFADIFQIKKSFEEQRNKLEDVVEKQMNEIIKDKNNGFGFEPTLRNIFAVVLANAEVFIRLMKDTHNKAFETSETRAKLLKGLTDEQSKNTPPIYPWPEIKKPISSGKQNVIAYPGEPELIEKLKSDNKTIWPEVDFVENYLQIVTNKIDTVVKDEPTVSDVHYVFETDLDTKKLDDISGIDVINESIPYTDKSTSSFVYEIYERALYTTLFDSFSNKMLYHLANEEYENIKESINEDIDLVNLVKKLKTIDDFVSLSPDGKQFGGQLALLSPFERFNYFLDHTPTVPYLEEIIDYPFSIEKYGTKKEKRGLTTEAEINQELLNYVPEDYRANIYPFNSGTYLGYLNKTSFSKDNFKFNGILKVDTENGFICSPINPESWVKDGYVTNLFNQNVSVSGSSVSILNTPYFHKQLYSDFNKLTKRGKYVGSAYLLINSLPYVDLDDTITFDGKSILVSSLFREISSTHFVPYHLMVKWGSMYHRYKRKIQDNVDILDGFLNSSNITQPITGSTFFDGGLTGTTFTGFTIDGSTVAYINQTDIGVTPYYHSIFHQIVNNYIHYNVFSGNTEYSGNTTSGKIKHRKRTVNNKNYYTVFVDNSTYDTNDAFYTLLPSDGGNVITQNVVDYSDVSQNNYRIWWSDETVSTTFSGKTFASSDEYLRNLNDTFSIGTNYRKVIDLIATFSPSILETFEEMFIEFATEISNDETPVKQFENIPYYEFQTLLRDLVRVDKTKVTSTNIEGIIGNLKSAQKEKSESITKRLVNVDSLMKFTLANPKEIDPYTFYGFTNFDGLSRYSESKYNSLDLTTTTQDLIKLYIGEDIDNHYENFFIINDIRLTETNIIRYRPMIQIYAGYVESGGTNTKTAFREYLRTAIFQRPTNNIVAGGADNRLKTFMAYLLPLISSDKNIQKEKVGTQIMKYGGYNISDTKLEMYNTFKSFNDKWTAGNSIGQRLLLEEFLFLDKANRDIGDKYFLNIDRILPLLDPKNAKVSLYTAISMLIQGSGLDMRALPAYVNFYGTNLNNNKSKVSPSKTVAKNLFGTFLEVDYQESSPKIIIQLVGNSSKRLDLSNSKEYKFSDDSFYIGSVNNNPLVVTSLENFSKNDLSKSNRVVAFEVSFGDQNQGIFKGLTLDQSTLKNTSESFQVLENLGRTASGAGAYNVDVSLFDYYKQASYSCEVTCMGNVMIQPTMFFYVKNIPMFRGSYWITEVSHSIQNNTISTKFTGTRIPYSSLPDPKDSFISSYRVLFDKLSNKAIALLKQNAENTPVVQEAVVYQNASYTIDRGTPRPNGETVVQKVGISEFGVPFNGYNNEKDVQKVTNSNYPGEWFRVLVVKMGGQNYPIDESVTMNLANSIKWSQISSSTSKFYSTKFQLTNNEVRNKITTSTTEFLNPKNGKKTTLSSNYQLDINVGPISVQGPVSIGPSVKNYGMAMSPSLMSELGLFDGDVVYFQIK